MKKRLIAGALGFLVVGAFGIVTPTSAQTPATGLKLTMSPNPVAPGGNVHVTPEQPCPGGADHLNWSLGPGSLGGSVVVASTMGGWDVTFKAPTQPGTYPFFADCMAPGGASATGQYAQGQFTVKAGAASALPGTPRHTG